MYMTDPPKIHIRVATMDDRTAMLPTINEDFAIEKFREGTRTDEAGLAEMIPPAVIQSRA